MHPFLRLCSVFVPGNLGDKKNLPVVFWIHGYEFTLRPIVFSNGGIRNLVAVTSPEAR